jgi:phosphoglycerate kinase
MFNRIQNSDCFQKTVLVRADLNVPMKNGEITDSTRLLSLKPTLDFLKSKQAKIVIMSHFGRPKPELDPKFWEEKYSLKPLLKQLSALTNVSFSFVSSCVGKPVQDAIKHMPYGTGLLLENLRYYPGEETNDYAFAKELGQSVDMYVNDAFSCSHRSHASIEGITHFVPSLAGISLQAELDSLHTLLENPTSPFVALVGGSKVSTKLDLLENLCHKVDSVIIGGAMAHTFWVAMGHSVGKSLYEPDYVETAKAIWNHHGHKIRLPLDCMVAERLENPEQVWSVPFDMIPENVSVFDMGPETIKTTANFLRQTKTVVWNGPVGAFEFPPFQTASVSIAKTIADLTQQHQIKSIVGGGDTLAALEMAGVKDHFTYLSTAGGAFLEWLEGKKLPGVIALEK